VFSRDWGNGDPHIYHLANSDGWVDFLPTEDGTVTLNRAYRYELRTATSIPPDWQLYEIPAE
jgi:hypothetical protein